ncbi:MAG: hypothetical protein S4CHLAM102_13760 [Chlamydiia bacterium]|nr:hypothetical protein [Chlamydiia bacterium]
MNHWVYFLALTIVFLFTQAFFTMMEMAIVSFDRVRLQYYVSQNNKKALWLSYLLQHPSYLFGTTLFGVNASLQVGAQTARQLYTSLGINPDWSPLSQIIVVLIFAELSPMFAARSHPEALTKMGIGVIYFLSKLLTPIIYLLDLLCNFVNWLFKSPHNNQHFLSREELQKAIESTDQSELDASTSAIFALKNATPMDFLTPIDELLMAPSDFTVRDLKRLIKGTNLAYVPVYSKRKVNILGLCYLRDLLRLSDDVPIRDYVRSPWYITKENSLYQVIKQFRWKNQNIAIVLDGQGTAVGILTLNSIINDIFHISYLEHMPLPLRSRTVIDRLFPANTYVTDINIQLGISIPSSRFETLEDLMSKNLKDHPHKGDRVRIGQFELKLEETEFMEEKKIRVTTL